VDIPTNAITRKGNIYRCEEIKLSLFTDNMIIYVGYPKELIKKNSWN